MSDARGYRELIDRFVTELKEGVQKEFNLTPSHIEKAFDLEYVTITIQLPKCFAYTLTQVDKSNTRGGSKFVEEIILNHLHPQVPNMLMAYLTAQPELMAEVESMLKKKGGGST